MTSARSRMWTKNDWDAWVPASEDTVCTIWPGTDKRFKCFIAHDGIFNTQQQYYETEEMWFPNWDLGAGPWRKGISADPDNAEKVNDQQKVNPFTTSPHLYVDRWDTPILCIHGEKDYRILSSQGQSAFSAAVMRYPRRTPVVSRREPLGIETPKRHIVAAHFLPLARPLVEKIN